MFSLELGVEEADFDGRAGLLGGVPGFEEGDSLLVDEDECLRDTLPICNNTMECLTVLNRVSRLSFIACNPLRSTMLVADDEIPFNFFSIDSFSTISICKYASNSASLLSNASPMIHYIEMKYLG